MHGACLDFVALCTIHGAANTCYTGECHGGGLVRDYDVFKLFGVDRPAPRRFQRVLDVGSQDINGNMRTYDFLGHPPTWLERIGSPEYVGIDLHAGRNVDLVMSSHAMTFEDESADLVTCLNMLEHDRDPQATINECFRVLEPGGELVLVCTNEKGAPHPHLAGGEDHYDDGITNDRLRGMLTDAGFLITYCLEHGGDNLAYCTKPKT